MVYLDDGPASNTGFMCPGGEYCLATEATNNNSSLANNVLRKILMQSYIPLTTRAAMMASSAPKIAATLSTMYACHQLILLDVLRVQPQPPPQRALQLENQPQRTNQLVDQLEDPPQLIQQLENQPIHPLLNLQQINQQGSQRDPLQLEPQRTNQQLQCLALSQQPVILHLHHLCSLHLHQHLSQR